MRRRRFEVERLEPKEIVRSSSSVDRYRLTIPIRYRCVLIRHIKFERDNIKIKEETFCFINTVALRRNIFAIDMWCLSRRKMFARSSNMISAWHGGSCILTPRPFARIHLFRLVPNLLLFAEWASSERERVSKHTWINLTVTSSCSWTLLMSVQSLSSFRYGVHD